jgi:hypothetical protein
MLIDSDNAGEGKVTKMTRETSLCYSRVINIEDAVSGVRSSFFESHLAERLSNPRGSITRTCEPGSSYIRPVDAA